MQKIWVGYNKQLEIYAIFIQKQTLDEIIETVQKYARHLLPNSTLQLWQRVKPFFLLNSTDPHAGVPNLRKMLLPFIDLTEVGRYCRLIYHFPQKTTIFFDVYVVLSHQPVHNYAQWTHGGAAGDMYDGSESVLWRYCLWQFIGGQSNFPPIDQVQDSTGEFSHRCHDSYSGQVNRWDVLILILAIYFS